jgi:leader peptidase (prepilin peptidase)/N-methyltransferase
MVLIVVFFALFGAIIGSFLNVFVLRHGVKTLSGRSACASCGRELETVDLVPILSWLFLRGRCRFCGSKISIQYPLVEATTAVAFAFIGATSLSLTLQIAALPIAALLISISVYDIKHGIIPDTWVYSLSGFVLLFSLAYLTSTQDLAAFTPLFLAGPASALPFWALWYVSNGQWMGLGDSKLAWAIGWLLGPVYAFVAIIAAFVVGALVSVCVLLPLSSPAVMSFLYRVTHTTGSGESTWGFTMRSEVAFGPFLAAACAVIWLMILFGHDPLAYLNAVLP